MKMPERSMQKSSPSYREILDDKEKTFSFGNAKIGEIEIIAVDAEKSGVMGRELTGIIYSDKYITLVKDVVKFPTGDLGTYIRLLLSGKNGGVCIVPKIKGKFVLLRQFRHATRRWHVEFPRGFAESDNLEDDARRELKEELGAETSTLRWLGAFFPDSGLLSSRVSVFVADLQTEPRAIGDNGCAELVLLTASEVEREITAGNIDDGITICAFHMSEH